MKIVISGTNEELAHFLKLAEIDEKFKLLVEKNAIEKKEEIDDLRFTELFTRISWDTLYLWDIINAHGSKIKGQPLGIYLTVNQLEKLGIDERSASARVGGAKKVALNLGMDDIIFIKFRNNEKRYYISDESIPSMLQLIEKNIDDYKNEFLIPHKLSKP